MQQTIARILLCSLPYVVAMMAYPVAAQWESLTPYEYTGDTAKGVVYHPNDIWLNDSNDTFIACTDEWQGGIRYKRAQDTPIDSFGVWLKTEDSIWIEVTHRSRQIVSVYYIDTFLRGPISWHRVDIATKGNADHFEVEVPSELPDLSGINITEEPVFVGLASVHRPIASVSTGDDSSPVAPEYFDVLGRRMTGGIIVKALGGNRFLVR